MVGDFQVFDVEVAGSETAEAREFCWAAPPGFVIYEGYPPKYKSLFQAWILGDILGIEWK